MQRRKFLVGVGAATAGGAALIGTGAFSRIESQRAVTIEVAEDPDAYLGLDKCDTPNGSYAHLDEHGHLQLLMNPENPHHTGDLEPSNLGAGINSDSQTWFDNVFQICNQGKEAACIHIEDSEDWPRVVDDDFPDDDYSEYDGDRRVDFYLGDDDSASIIGEANAFSLDLGECVCIGLKTNSKGLSDGDELLSVLENEITIVADVDGDCFDDPSPVECEECSFDTSVTTSSEVTVESTNSGGFPAISAFLDIETAAGESGDLTSGDFVLCEDSCEQEVSVEITGEDKPVDFVFALDVTGSMGPYIDGLKNDIQSFIDDLEAEGIDARYALYLFGDDDGSGQEPPAVFLKQDFTSDSSEFKDAVDDTSLGEEVGLGGLIPEDNYEVIITPTCELSFRTGAERAFIDITDAPSDEDPDQNVCGLPEIKQSAIDVLNGDISGFDGFTYFAVSPTRTGTHEKRTIADEVDGTWIELGSDFDPILSAIESEIAGSYRVSYTTTNPVEDGTNRMVVIEIEDPAEGTLYAVTNYTAPST